MIPSRITIENKTTLLIIWDDGNQSRIGLKELRLSCPCATCLTEKAKQSKTYIPLFNKDQFKVSSINSVGSYAINIIWQDGHNTGIYEYSYLKNLSTQTSVQLRK
ncbi:MAG: hypothetical protein Kow0098_17100 [Ignavibacteriaceae bacterium]